MKIDSLKDHPVIIHCHSTYSDGSKSIPEIASIAESVGIRFLMMTDHNNLRALADGHAKWYGNVCVDIGYELNDKDDKNHFLAFNLKHEVNRTQRPRDYVKDVITNGGFGFIAHPFEQRVKAPNYSIYPWTDWGVKNFTGIEIWNHMSAWMEGLSSLNGIMRVIHPRQSVWGPKTKSLDLWDEVAINRKVSGIGGADAHEHIHKIAGPLKIAIFRYKIIFKCLRTYIITDQSIGPSMPYTEALNLLHSALKSASVFFAQYYLGDPSGYRFWIAIKDKIFPMGSELIFEEGMFLQAIIPRNNVFWRVIKDGKEWLTGNNQNPELPVESAGVYRMEVYRKGRPWLFSNHLFIRKGK